MPLLIGALAGALWATPAPAQEDRPVLFHTPARQTVGREPFTVEGLLIDGKRVEKLFLRFRTLGEAYRTVEMEVQYGDVYRGIIPGKWVQPPALEYYVQGVTFDGKPVLLYQSERKPARVRVVNEAPQTEVPAPPPLPPPSEKPARTEPPPPPDRPERPVTSRPPDPGASPRAVQESPPPPPTTVAEAPPPPKSQKPPPPGSKPSEREKDPAASSAEDRGAGTLPQEEAAPGGPELRAVIAREQIRSSGARTVADVLDLLAGVTVSREVSGFYRAGVRGMRSDPEVLVQINGQPINDPYDGRAMLELPAFNLERVELTRGPGAGGLIATVNLVTDRRDGVRATATGGTSTTADAHAAGAWSLGAIRLAGDLDVGLTDGVVAPVPHDSLDAQRDAQRYRADPGDPVGLTQDRLLLLNLGLSGVYSDPSLGKIGASARLLLEGRNALIGAFDTLGTGSWLTWQSILGEVSYERSLTPAIELAVRARVGDHRAQRKFLLSPPLRAGDDAGSPSTFCTRPLPLGACATGYVFPEGMQELQQHAALGYGGEASIAIQLAQSNALQVGLRARRTSVYQSSFQTNFDLDLASVAATAEAGGAWPTLGGSDVWTQTTAHLFAQDTWALLPQLTLLAGISAGVSTLPDPATLPTGQTGMVLSPEIGPKVAVRFTPMPSLALSAGYARGVRPPTIAELSAGLPQVQPYLGRSIGNPLLQPVALDAVEAAAEWLYAQGDARVRLRAAGFFEWFSSPVVALDTAGDLVPLSNRPGVYVVGAEAEARLETGSRASGWANTSWFRAMDAATPSAFQLLTEVPQLRFNSGFTLPVWELLDLDVLVQVASERRSNARTGLELLRRWRIPASSSIVVQLRTGPIAGHFTGALTVRNALDEDRVDDAPRMDRVPGGVPRGGRSIFGSISMSY
ncbi:MAG TPA: TonB-dependent receptor [Myxococcales bacterium]|nr:TonB-dependent receptor [Myxococcales bacterium]